MRIADTDPDELDDDFDDDGRPRSGPGSRRRKLAVIAGAVVVLAGVGASVVLTGEDDPADEVSRSTTVESSEIVDPGSKPAVGVGPAPDGFPDYGSDYMGPQLETMFQRTTETGIRLTLQNSGDWQNFEIEGDVFVVGGVAETIAIAVGEVPPDAPPGTGVQQQWIPPEWCNPIGGFRLTMMFKDAIGVSNGSRNGEPRDGLAVTLFSSGYAEGAPFRALRRGRARASK